MHNLNIIDNSKTTRNKQKKSKVQQSINKLNEWLINNDLKGFEPFDGLSSFLKALTFKNWFAERILQQVVLRCPFNIRPFIGIKPYTSTEGVGFLARGYLRLWKATQNDLYKDKALFCLNWLLDSRSKGFSGNCWGEVFDYAARPFQLPKYTPTVVWTSFIGHAFLDAFEILKKEKYLNIAVSICNFIIKDLNKEETDKGSCISYIPGKQISLHNSNMLGAGMLARTCKYIRNEQAMKIAQDAVEYSCERQLQNGSWYYGEAKPYHWIDNWHTAYILDSLKCYIDSTNDNRYSKKLREGFDFYKNNFFEDTGKPKYYFDRLFIVDIQCSSQAIDTFAYFHKYDKSSVALAIKIAEWTIANMQDTSGYFYYRLLQWKKVKIPMLHWGQATMLCALSHLLLMMDEI